VYNHAPEDYHCPICLGVQGIENEHTLLKQQDLVYKDDVVSAFINSFFIGNNPGHVIVVPNTHIENLYDLSPDVAEHIMVIAKKIALVMKQVYACQGITTLQNNEPAGNQHAFHFHLHIFPRYENDDLHMHMNNKRLAEPSERLSYAKKLIDELQK